MDAQARRIFKDYIRSRIDWWHQAFRKGVPADLQADALKRLSRLV